MKNEQIKREFLTTLPKNQQLLMEQAFHEVEPLENLFNKDCSLFTSDEMDKFFITVGCKNSMETISNEWYLLDLYVTWLKNFNNNKNKYASYSSFANKHFRRLANNPKDYKIKTPTKKPTVFDVDHLNQKRIYSLEEFRKEISRLFGFEDRILFMAIYEGVWTEKHTKDLFLLEIKDLDTVNSIISLPHGCRISVSHQLIYLLTENAKVINRVNAKHKLCYKGLKIDSSLKQEAVKDVIDKYIQERREENKRWINNYSKFTVSNIQMSGFINMMIQAGIKKNFNDPVLYQKNHDATMIANRYEIDYCEMRKGNLQQRLAPYFIGE